MLKAVSCHNHVLEMNDIRAEALSDFMTPSLHSDLMK